MINKLLTISIAAFALTACGGSSDGGTADPITPDTGGTPDGGGGTPDAGGTPDVDAGGQSGLFGDAATADNGIDAVGAVCPATVTSSFTGFALDGDSWCVFSCPSDAEVENADGDEFGFIRATGETCHVTTAAAGTPVTAPLFAPIMGCPEGGCTDGSAEQFPRVLVTANASTADLAGSYNCVAWLFDGGIDRWEAQATPAPFDLTLGADGSASVDGTATTFSFANAVLTLEGSMTLNNVAIGSGSFSSYDSNTALTRCTS